METGIITFDGFKTLEITTAEARMVVVTEMGPRVSFFGQPGGDNLFYWNVDDKGREGWRLLGGHRVWVSRPGADEAEDAYAADNDPCTVENSGDTVVITGAEHPVFKIKRGLKITEINASTFEVEAFVTNTGPMLFSGGVWALTCTDPGGGKTYGIPLGDRSSPWDLIHIVIPRTWADHTAPVNDPQIQYNEEFMIFRPQGVESKRAVKAPHGIIALTWPDKRLSFIKKSIFNPRGTYPCGCNVAAYIGPDNFMVEMETMGEEVTLMPGQTMENTEIWKLAGETLDWQSPARILELMNV